MNSRNILLIFCIIILFVLHFYLEYGYMKLFIENFDNARDKFFEKIDRIYYINLEHRNDRKDEFLSNFSPEDEAKIRRVDAVYTKEKGAIGCLKSHIKALEMAVSEGKDDDIVMVCEDDFYIKDIFYCNRMLDWGFKVLEKWDVIMLAQNIHASEETTLEYPISEEEPEKKAKIFRVIHAATGSGYLIHKSYIPKLLEIYKGDDARYEATKEFKAEYCNDVSWRYLQEKDNWFAFKPAIGVQRSSYSDIQKGVVDYGL